MPVIEFSGHVTPLGSRITISNLPPFKWARLDGSLTEEYLVTIQDSNVTVKCDTSRVEDEGHISRISNKAYVLARSPLDLWVFQQGIGIGLSLDSIVVDGGTRKVMYPLSRGLNEVAFFIEDQIPAMYSAVNDNESLLLALNDLSVSVTHPHFAPTNCARAMDGIRNILAPSAKPDKGWEALQCALRVKPDYVKPISEFSKSSRHGLHGWKHVNEVEKIIHRSWVLMNRYLFLRTQGFLPESQFLMLEDESPLPKPPT